MRAVYRLKPETLIKNNSDSSFLMDILLDENVVILRGEYHSFLSLLKDGVDARTLSKEFKIEESSATELLDYICRAGVFENREPAAALVTSRTFSLLGLEVSVMPFEEALPQSSGYNVYASYCASMSVCNCCTASDNCIGSDRCET